MNRLDLSDDDASELDVALTQELHGLRTELASADDRAFRANLRARLDRLERIAARLTESIRHPPTSSQTPADSRRAERLAEAEVKKNG